MLTVFNLLRTCIVAEVYPAYDHYLKHRTTPCTVMHEPLCSTRAINEEKSMTEKTKYYHKKQDYRLATEIHFSLNVTKFNRRYS